MSSKSDNRRMAENEVVFRMYNEQLEAGFANLGAIAKEDGQEDMLHAQPDTLHFFCECSDENCRFRVKMMPDRYAAIHEQRDQFVVIPGHDTAAVERIVGKEAEYWIVEKHEVPPEDITVLHETPAHNV